MAPSWRHPRPNPSAGGYRAPEAIDADVAIRPPAAVHVDLDGAGAIFEAHGWRAPSADDPLFASGLTRILDFLEERSIAATLFVIARDLDHGARHELLREAVRRGHDIGSHTTSHRWLPALPRDEKRREIEGSRDRIAAALGVTPVGFRAPGFGVDRETLELIAAAGYHYDSSVFPTSGFARRLGLDRIPGAPFAPFGGEALLELPLPGYAPLPVPFHPSYSLVLGTSYFRIGLARFRRAGQPLVLLFHLTDLSDPLPGSWRRGVRPTVFTLSFLSAAGKRRRCGAMLDLVAAHYRVVPTRSLTGLEGAGVMEGRP